MKNELLEQRRAQMFPKLSPAQIARLQTHARRVDTHGGEVLSEPGTRHKRVLVVLAGEIDVMLPDPQDEELITTLGPGEFTGELSTLRGVAGLTRIRVREAGSVLAIEDQDLRRVIAVDAELSELIMRAFILRRMGLVSTGKGEVMLIGSRHSAGTLRLREFLTRNAHPYSSLDVDEEADVQALLERFHVAADELPVVIGHCGRVFRNPGIADIARYLDMNPTIDAAAVHDLVVVGAGPAGLAAAVYAASEGLDVVVVEAMAFGGQAGSSSKIENYLGFPTGISGQALAGRAFVQAQKFGARILVASTALRLDCSRRPYAVELDDGRALKTRTIIIASGAEYRMPQIEDLERFVGLGIYHAATHLEAKLCDGQEAAIVGGGNSAGQAAVFLANGCRHVHILVRGEGLADSMSSYLIRRIEESPRITLHTRTQITSFHGNGSLQKLTWRRAGSDAETRDIAHVFLMTGAVPNTRWLEGCVALDGKKFVRTGSGLKPDELAAAGWSLARAPHLLETSAPGVFAVGDVRSGSVKRVASAVGEGSICVSLVHEALRELPPTQAAIEKW
jgi:thioredoxin reductase (NADPH)